MLLSLYCTDASDEDDDEDDGNNAEEDDGDIERVVVGLCLAVGLE